MKRLGKERSSMSLPTGTNARQARAAALALLTAACAWSGIAGAGEPPPRFELTLQAGYRIGGELEEANSRRITLNVRAEADTQWEVLFGRQGTTLETDETFAGAPLLDLDVDYLHVGGTYQLAGSDVRPFVVATLGLTRFEPRGVDLDAETDLSASIGGGVHLRPEKRIGVRLEGRLFTTLVDSDGDMFCKSGSEGAACAIRIDGDAVTQLEVGVGVVFRF